jgi:hypothetical protein
VPYRYSTENKKMFTESQQLRRSKNAENYGREIDFEHQNSQYSGPHGSRGGSVHSKYSGNSRPISGSVEHDNMYNYQLESKQPEHHLGPHKIVEDRSLDLPQS